ncbi:MORN repeat-containing protein [Leptospira fainei]|uniref:MORN repeat-containing protein n=1 Tax=Leptospira fainei TaxID=48782 RepID=UPI0005878D03|nr:membrane-binding protein [Leptospira fainei]
MKDKISVSLLSLRKEVIQFFRKVISGIRIKVSILSFIALSLGLYVFYLFFPKLAVTCVTGNCWFGIGTLQYSDGNIYKGECLFRSPQGHGEFISPKNEHYLGEWTWGKKNGFGIYYYSNGDIYEGKFSNNIKEGLGIFTWKSGVRYIGNWINGEPSGRGKLLLNNDKIILEGEYRKGIIYEGKGMYVYEDGTRYIGEWKEGRREGFGILLDSDGQTAIFQGNWKNDQPIN